MLEGFFRGGVLLVVGLAIGLAAIWYLSIVYQQIFGTTQIVIDQFVLIRKESEADDKLGTALAQMLQARLQALGSELQEAQAGLTANASPVTATTGQLLRGVQFFDQRIGLKTTLLQPFDVKLSVAGVDVGGVIPWLQRSLAKRRTLRFAVYSEGDEAEIVGSLEALGFSERALSLTVKGADGKEPGLTVIIDRLAHEMLRRYLAQEPANKLELLDPPEFVDLADVIIDSARVNRRVIGGLAASNEFVPLVPKIAALADKVPSWPELGYLAAWIADKANASEQALKYYQRAVAVFASAKNTAVVDAINVRISALTPALAPAEAPAGPIPAKVDYSGQIHIRDSGPEGSVVGQALATALDFQILKATQRDVRTSARYIYYASRKVGKVDPSADTGARLQDGLDALRRDGAVEESVWPYKAGKYNEQPPAGLDHAERFHIDSVKQLHTLKEVKASLREDGPVVIGIPVFQGMMSPEAAKTGVVPLPKDREQVIGGHAVVIVGYDDDARRMKFANSWGTGWGEQGFGYLPYEYLEKYMDDAWSFKLASAQAENSK